jgi:hypothetical protein
MPKFSLLRSVLMISMMLFAANAAALIEAGAFYTFINKNSGQVLDVLGASMNDGAKLVQHPSNGGHNQIFQAKNCGLPWYCFLNRHSGKALDVPSGTLQRMFRFSNGLRMTLQHKCGFSTKIQMDHIQSVTLQVGLIWMLEELHRL